MSFRARTLWLALKALFVVALTAGGTVVPSSVFAYDAPVFARVESAGLLHHVRVGVGT